MSRLGITKDGAALYIDTTVNKLYGNGNITNVNNVWYPWNTPAGVLKSVNIDEHNYNIGLVVDSTLYTSVWGQSTWVNRGTGAGMVDVAMLSDGRWYQIEVGGKLVFRNDPNNGYKNTVISTPGPVSHISAGGNWWGGRITIDVNGQDYTTDWDYSNKNPTWTKGIDGRPNGKKWVSTAGKYWYLVIHTTTFEFIDRTTYVKLPLPADIIQFELNHRGVVIALDKDGYLWWSNSPLDNASTYRWTKTTNKLPNPKYPGTYYGNSKNSPKYTTITLTKGKTDGIPVLHWRKDIEWHYNSCGWSSGCDTLNRAQFPFSNNGLCIEAPNGDSSWVQKKGRGNCIIIGHEEAWCFVPNDFLTHVFGQEAGTLTIPANTTQYSTPNAGDLQITPFDKVMNTSDGTMNTFNADYRDPRWMDNNKKPTFASLKFKIPEPTQTIDIDVNIPIILLNYYESKWLELNQLNDYLGKYLFTEINGVPRISFKTGTFLPSQIADLWKKISGNGFSTSSHNYCKSTTLKGAYCKTFCKLSEANCDTNLLEFCGKPGTGKLPKYTHNGILPTEKVTKKMLDDAYPNYSLFSDVCGCNMPKEYYRQLNISVYQNMKDGEKLYSTLFAQGGLGGVAKCDPLTECRDGISLPNKADIVAVPNCPPIAIQNCIQENIVAIGGPVSGLNSENTQNMNCTQNISDSTKNTNTNNTNNENKETKTTETTGTTGTTNKTTIIIIIVLLSVLGVSGLSFLLFKLLVAK
jgi:hypothetical protein